MAGSASEVYRRGEKLETIKTSGPTQLYAAELRQTLFRAQLIIETIAENDAEIKKILATPLKLVIAITKGSLSFGK